MVNSVFEIVYLKFCVLELVYLGIYPDYVFSLVYSMGLVNNYVV